MCPRRQHLLWGLQRWLAAADYAEVSHLLAWLTDNVRNAAAKCGARGASVYVPTPWNDTSPGLLIHVGDAPLPEMTDVTRAYAFAQSAEARASEAQSSETLTSEARSGERAAQPGALTVRPSQAPEGCLIPVPLLAAHWRGASTDREPVAAGAPQRRLADEHVTPPIVGWLGLRFAKAPGPLVVDGGWPALLELASALASTYVCFYGILTDPVTGLPGRAELQGTLRAELERVQATGRPFSLLFVKLGELEEINQTAGRRTGDAVLREFIELLQRTLRSSDVVMRYGGAIFALPLRDVAATGAMIVADKIHRHLLRHTFLQRGLDRGVSVTCAIGVVAAENDDARGLQPLDFLRRADQALAASCARADRAPVLWRPDDEVSHAAPHDPLLGVFTGQAEKDYRNMRLLWDVLDVLGNDADSDLAGAAVARTCALFRATRAALFEADDHRALHLVAGRQQRPGESEPAVLTTSDLTDEERALSARALTTGEPQFATLTASVGPHGPTDLTACALPLVIGRRAVGALYLLSRADANTLEQSDLPVLTCVATHLGLALDRARLAAEHRRRAEEEQTRLRAEVERLQTAVQHAKLVFRSTAMTILLDTTRRVAMTDATVLLTGESGTGKEMLAHTLHSLGARYDKPLVIVDCGAIPASLMDSELFGRERGAYTGAERRVVGRLAQADAGTVFLDEIGELPLEVQTKLLRFVQERTLTMVGGTTAHRIDVRIVAATNRDLEAEVRAGRFREDLFHRLNVVRLRLPPLRERRDDIPVLARHFLELFAMQYRKAVRGFTPEADAALHAHAWPGNVRELQNTILQAVVLASADRITLDDLRLPTAAAAPSATTRTATATATATPQHAAPAFTGATADWPAWQTLTDRLREQIAATNGQSPKPIGKWLGYEVVLQAYDLSDGVMTRAAGRVGLPDTTFVRRLRQAQAETVNIRYPETWSAVRAAVLDVLRGQAGADALADRIDDLLLSLVLADEPGLARAAALVGVSTPTLKRRKSELPQRPAACA